MNMNIVDVCNYVYPGQKDLGNISFGQDRNGPIFITYWNVPNVPQPTVEQLQDLIPTYQNQFDYDYFVSVGTIILKDFIDSVARQKHYDNAVSCASYINSTITQWKNEATVFIEWRDSIYNYVISQQALMQNGERSIPSFEEFEAELPEITWPD